MMVAIPGNSNNDEGDAGSRAGTGPVSQWSGFRGGADRLGWAAGPSSASNDTLWTFDAGRPIQSSPVIGGGLLFFGSDSGYIHALNPSSGIEVWNRSAGEFATVQSTPCYDDGALYIGTQNGSHSELLALNASDGGLLWSVPDDSGIPSSPVESDGTVYYGSLNGSMVAVTSTSGSILWQTQRDGDIWGSPAVWNGTVFAGTIKGEVFALWAENGTVRWNITYPYPWTVYATPAVRNGTVYIGLANYGALKGELLALDAATGAIKWNFTECQSVYASVAVTDDVLYAHIWNKTVGGGFLAAMPLEEPSGDGVMARSELLWSFQTFDWEGGSSPLVTDNAVIVGSTDNRVYAVNRTTGIQLWNVTTQGIIVSSPAVFERKVFAGSMDGKLYSIGSVSELPGMKLTMKLERESLASGSVMRISVWLRDEAGNPVEGGYIKFRVGAGNLSQNGASTFPDGSQSVKFMAQSVKANTTVTLTAEGARGGLAPTTGSVSFTVTPYKSTYQNVKSQSTFNAAKYTPYFIALAVLCGADITLLGMFIKRRWLTSGKPRSPQ